MLLYLTNGHNFVLTVLRHRKTACYSYINRYRLKLKETLYKRESYINTRGDIELYAQTFFQFFEPL